MHCIPILILSLTLFTRTYTDTSVPSEDQATQGLDYLPTSSNVRMGDNVTSATVSITILHVSDSVHNHRESNETGV